MKRLCLLAILTFGLDGCLASPPDPLSALWGAEATLTTAANLDIAYRKLPVCSPTQTAPCFDPVQQAKITKGLLDAKTLMIAAEKSVLGCDLPTYISSHQNPPIGTCGTPLSDMSVQQAIVTTAQNAIDAVKSLVPLK